MAKLKTPTMTLKRDGYKITCTFGNIDSKAQNVVFQWTMFKKKDNGVYANAADKGQKTLSKTTKSYTFTIPKDHFYPFKADLNYVLTRVMCKVWVRASGYTSSDPKRVDYLFEPAAKPTMSMSYNASNNALTYGINLADSHSITTTSKKACTRGVMWLAKTTYNGKEATTVAKAWYNADTSKTLSNTVTNRHPETPVRYRVYGYGAGPGGKQTEADVYTQMIFARPNTPKAPTVKLIDSAKHIYELSYGLDTTSGWRPVDSVKVQYRDQSVSGTGDTHSWTDIQTGVAPSITTVRTPALPAVGNNMARVFRIVAVRDGLEVAGTASVEAEYGNVTNVTNFKATRLADGKVKLTWDVHPNTLNSARIILSRKLSGKDYANLYTWAYNSSQGKSGTFTTSDIPGNDVTDYGITADVGSGVTIANGAGNKVNIGKTSSRVTTTVLGRPLMMSKVTATQAKDGDNQATISWTNASGNYQSGVEVVWSTDSNGASSSNTADRTTQEFPGSTLSSVRITNLELGKTYYFWLRAYSDNGGSKIYSSQTSAVKLTLQSRSSSPVKNVKAVQTSIGSTSVQVTWNNDTAKAQDGVEIEWDTDTLGEYGSNKPTTQDYPYGNREIFYIEGLTLGDTYAIRIRSYTLNGNEKIYSAYSSWVTVKLQELKDVLPSPDPIQNLTAVQTATGSDKIQLTWVNGEKTQSGVVIEWDTDTLGYASSNPPSSHVFDFPEDTTFTIEGLSDDETYYIRARAYYEKSGTTVYSAYTPFVKVVMKPTPVVPPVTINPVAVSDVTAKQRAVGSGDIIVNWANNTTAQSGVDVAWSTNSNAFNTSQPPTQYEFEGGTKKAFTITNLEMGVTYYVWVRSYYMDGTTKKTTNWSNAVSVEMAKKTVNPTNVTNAKIAQYRENNPIIVVTWENTCSEMTGVDIAWDTDNLGFESSSPPTVQEFPYSTRETFYIEGADLGKTYYVWIRTYVDTDDGRKETSWLSCGSVTMAATTPNTVKPTNVKNIQAVQSKAGTPIILLTWDNTFPEQTGVEIAWDTDGHGFSGSSLPTVHDFPYGDREAFYLEDLKLGERYYIWVRAYYESGGERKVTSWSDVISVLLEEGEEALEDRPTQPEPVITKAQQVETETAVQLEWEVGGTADRVEMAWSEHPEAFQTSAPPQTLVLEKGYTSGKVVNLEYEVPYYFWVRTMKVEYGEELWSPWSERSEAVVLYDAVDSPVLSLSRSFVEQDKLLSVSWTVDNMRKQIGAQIEIATQGSEDYSVLSSITGTATTNAVRIAKAPGLYNLRVTVYYATASATSESVELLVATVPSCSLSAALSDIALEDGEVVQGITAYPLQCNISGAEDSEYKLSIYALGDLAIEHPAELEEFYEGQCIWSETVEVGTLLLEELPLYNNGYYRLLLECTDPYTLLHSTPQMVDFYVFWEQQPTEPTVSTAQYTSEGIVLLTPVQGAGGNASDVCDIYRNTEDGRVLCYGNALFGDVLEDTLPTLYSNATPSYCFCTKATTGQEAFCDITLAGTIPPPPAVSIQFGENSVSLYYNVSVSDTRTKQGEIRTHLGGSKSYYGLSGIERKQTIRGEIPKSDRETVALLYELSRYEGVCYVRTNKGIAYYATVNCSLDYSEGSLLCSYTVDTTEVDPDGNYMATLREEA